MKYTKEELEEFAEILGLPEGACVCESKDGGLLVEALNVSLLQLARIEDGIRVISDKEYQKIDNIRPKCSGNYIKVKK